ncbi:MAG: DUF1015 domain-containing protein [Candidatus Ratteibacteria bacterium]|nr:DUF1015 domain-containing protein [Candidatus Ratteibacteria bacterium]
MVEIRPFRGYRYNLDRVGDISRVIAPPWDVIDSRMEGQLLSSSPFNIIKLISKNCSPGDVKEKFDRWIEDGILKQDIDEGFYFIKHRFRWMGKEYTRKGFFALLRLEDFTTGNVIPHEKIFEKHSINRYYLIERCRVNFSPVFMLYQDESYGIEKIVDNNNSSTVVSEGFISESERFEFGVITGNEDIRCIKNIVSLCNLIIADGHHRYNAALKYYKDNPAPENGFVLIFLVNINSPDVLILPTHRYIPSGASFIDNMETFKRYFNITEVSGLEKIHRLMAEETKNIFGVYEDDRFFVIVLKDMDDVKEHLSQKFSDKVMVLDTVILHEFIFPFILKTEPQDVVIYHQSPEYLIDEYKKKKSGVIFFLNPISKKHFLDVCFSGELMPQKTTYFYPKVPSGLVIYKFGK